MKLSQRWALFFLKFIDWLESTVPLGDGTTEGNVEVAKLRQYFNKIRAQIKSDVGITSSDKDVEPEP